MAGPGFYLWVSEIGPPLGPTGEDLLAEKVSKF